MKTVKNTSQVNCSNQIRNNKKVKVYTIRERIEMRNFFFFFTRDYKNLLSDLSRE